MTIFGALVLALPLAATSAEASPRPKAPHVSRGACPGECCGYGGIWTARQDSEVLTGPRSKAPVAFRVRKGETVVAVTGSVVTMKLGQAVVRRAVRIGNLKMSVGPADRVIVLYSRGEGWWRVWVRGQLDDAELNSENDQCAEDERPVECDAQVVVSPQVVWWVRVRAIDGREGWTRQLDDFSGVYSCGE